MINKPECAIDLEKYVGKERNQVRNPCITAREAIAIANYIGQLESALNQEKDKNRSAFGPDLPSTSSESSKTSEPMLSAYAKCYAWKCKTSFQMSEDGFSACSCSGGTYADTVNRAEMIAVALNNYDRLREALKHVLNAKSMEDYHDARALLQELDNLEKQQ